MGSEGVAPRRVTIAGAVLTAGLIVGLVLGGTFEWSPYYWQWLAYHNGLLVIVIIYLLLPSSKEAPRRTERPPVALGPGRTVRTKEAKVVIPRESK